MQLIIILVIIYLIIKYIKKEKTEINENGNIGNSKNNLKKIFFGILLFIPLFYVYYFLIAIITGTILWIFARAIEGIWAYAIILGVAGSPIFTILTISKILNKKYDIGEK